MSFAYHFSGFARWLRLIRQHGLPKNLFYFTGGIGDQLLCSAVACELKKRKEQRIWFMSEVPELFDKNPDFAATPMFDLALIPWARMSGARVQRLYYQEYNASEERDTPLTEPAIAALCRRTGITGEILLRPYIPAIARLFSPPRQRPRIALHSSCLSARYPIANKQWPIENMQRVSSMLSGWADLIQLGAKDDPLLTGVKDLRGVSLITGGTELAQCDLFVGMVGFLMHLARAVECPSVIIYGGRESPEYTGYSCNTNIAECPPCSPCWYYSRCDFQRRCLTGISPEQVVRAVEQKLSAPCPRPLPADSFILRSQ